MHSNGDLQPDDWPYDWAVPVAPQPAARRRGPRIAALTLTALVALGAGAGAVYVYQAGLAGSTPAASASQGSTAAPGPSETAQRMLLVGPVRAVGRAVVTVGGGPVPEISAQVTSATQFTGSARSLAQVRVGDTVVVQIAESDGVARVISLQDPATAS